MHCSSFDVSPHRYIVFNVYTGFTLQMLAIKAKQLTPLSVAVVVAVVVAAAAVVVHNKLQTP